MSKYIDAEWLLNFFEPYPNDYQTPLGSLRACVDDAPSIDIVRCQDCKYWVYNFNGCSRNPCTEPWYATDFCSYGSRSGKPNNSTISKMEQVDKDINVRSKTENSSEKPNKSERSSE